MRSVDKTRLSTRGLYSDIVSHTVVPEAIEYEPDYALWSDGVQKRRWLLLPPGTKIDTRTMAHWQFPVGTKVFKEFSVRGKLIETRMIERMTDATGNVKHDFFMGTFVWNAEQTEAVLTDDGVPDAMGTDHDVPPQTACSQCHRGEPGAMLGVSAVQLSRSGMLDTLAKRSLLSVDPQRTFPIPGNEIQVAAVGYVNANCGHCHSSDGIADQLRLRFLPEEADSPIEESEIYKTSIGKKVTDWKVHPDEVQMRVVPGDPEHSALLYRMMQRGPEKPAVDDQMPPIATERVHHDGVAAVQAWITTMRPLPPDSTPNDDTKHTGDMGAAGAGAHAAHPVANMAAGSGSESAAGGGGAGVGSAGEAAGSGGHGGMDAGSATGSGDAGSAGGAGTSGLPNTNARSGAAGSGGSAGAAGSAAGSGTAGSGGSAGAAGSAAGSGIAGSGDSAGAAGSAAGSGTAGSGGVGSVAGAVGSLASAGSGGDADPRSDEGPG